MWGKNYVVKYSQVRLLLWWATLSQVLASGVTKDNKDHTHQKFEELSATQKQVAHHREGDHLLNLTSPGVVMKMIMMNSHEISLVVDNS